MKKARQSKILEIINTYDVETQDELIVRLREHGLDVTQATISRDIRELKLTKVSGGAGMYKYVQPKDEKNADARLSSTLTDSIIHVDHALNQIVLKTYPGMAGAVAVSVDSIDKSEILGCVAGDDTIIVVCRTIESAQAIADNIQHLIRAL